MHQISHNATFCNRNGALWDMAQMHSGICEMGLLILNTTFGRHGPAQSMSRVAMAQRWRSQGINSYGHDGLDLPSSLQYKSHLSRQLHCWSLRCSWSIACRRCFNYIFILDLTPGFNQLGKDDCKTRWESFNLILEILGSCPGILLFSIRKVNWLKKI